GRRVSCRLVQHDLDAPVLGLLVRPRLRRTVAADVHAVRPDPVLLEVYKNGMGARRREGEVGLPLRLRDRVAVGVAGDLDRVVDEVLALELADEAVERLELVAL